MAHSGTLQPNAARLSRFKFAFDLENTGQADGWQSGMAGADWPTVEARTLIDQLDDLAQAGTLALPLKFSQSFGTPINLALAYPLTCRYQTSFEVEELPSSCQLTMDARAIAGKYTIYINGQPLDPARFVQSREYDICNRSHQVGPLLVRGLNTLVVRVEVGRDWDGLLDPLYLTGNFGVYANNEGRLVMAEPPEAARLTAGPPPGYPFYAGTLAYSSGFTLAELPQEPEFELAFDGWDANLHDCVEVLLNGLSLGIRAWSPYFWQGKSETLKVSENTLEIRVTNTLVGLLEGKYFDYEGHRLLDVEVSPKK